MGVRVAMEVSLAAAEAAKLADVDVVAAYPITPQTHIVEHLAELVADGELDAEYVPVESEHSAMSACVGSSAVGARTFTASCAQGLALMHEILFIASAIRTPMVMVIVNRALSAPISIWNDHSDIMAERDIGWIQTFAENGQEVLDLTLHAFRVAEDQRVLLPFIVNLDGFTLSHVIEPIEIPDKEDVRRFLPEFNPPLRLDPDRPISIGPVGIPEVYTEARKQLDEALQNSKGPIIEAWEEFGNIFGRYYKPVETYRTEDAEVLLLTMGSISETAMTAVDEMREKGLSVGLVRIRLWRPFPVEELRDAIKGAATVAVVDRALSYGLGGPVCSEVRSVMYSLPKRPHIVGFVAGLGGRDVTREMFEEMVQKAMEYTKEGKDQLYEMVGVREL
jgi:pyruvate ferredoxin oxidoreductase alpha subunit